MLRIDIWSDIACPWCYVGKRRLEEALERFPGRDAVQVRWRAFELDPAAPPERDRSEPYALRLARKYGTSTGAAEAMIQRMTEVAALEGLELRFDRIRPGNTFDAHRLIHLGDHHGRQDQVKERLLRAYLTEGESMADHAALERLAAEVGLERDEVRALLAGDRFSAEVRADEDAARELGIGGVPFFVVAGRYAVSGAQPADFLLEALERAGRELELGAGAWPAAGPVCGLDGCD